MKQLYLRLAAIFAVFAVLVGGLFAGNFFLRALQENCHYLDQLLTGLEDNLKRAYQEEQEKRSLVEQDYLNRAWAVEYMLGNVAVTQTQLEGVRQLMEVEGIALLDRQGQVLQSAGQKTGPSRPGPAFDGKGEQLVIDEGDFYTAPTYLYVQVLSGEEGRVRVRLDARADRLGLQSPSQLVEQVLRSSTTEADTLLGAVDGTSGQILALSANNLQTLEIRGGEDPRQRLELLRQAAEKEKSVILAVNGEYHTVLVRQGEGVYLVAMTKLGSVLSGLASTLAQGLGALAALSLLAMGGVHLYLKRYLFDRIAAMEQAIRELLAGNQPELPSPGEKTLPELRPLAHTLDRLRREYLENRQGVRQMECQLSQARNQASRDPLTGLYNRSGFEERARQLLDQGGAGVMLMFDLDNFKQVNDGEGHPVGDQLLVTFARCLQENLRKTDLVARLGGDEFVALLPGFMDPALLEEKLQSLMESARQALRPYREKYGLSVSVGAAAADSQVNQYQDLYCCADTALYIAKYQGKDGYYINHKKISCMRQACIGCRKDCPRSAILRQIEQERPGEEQP